MNSIQSLLKTEEEGTFFNSFYEASLDTKTKTKSPQHVGKKNKATSEKFHTIQNGIYSKYARLA